ncbi:hypothetical protein CAOG_02601 [Capsaspora owczarzaki ATCC 30864]|uniref:Uncharacterized protein n=1 Tax=Capsaspora owczarzaki (strain ATCC 30864) TaxID=595528 RepID=A0A0D2WLK0_CAPO3|nr:hypothetical protein CAOG_02601 [Capsaspora owczarzaki ATCC 30864]KJE91470.1 hypothetical protein CAOG_002601 [Capsaspora owczarzaki ATCC 30864]|eukprot:XP_004349351.2 hypothetical protein CAOG_02601 [Capsaspora owczarzaki ATCC 30864]
MASSTLSSRAPTTPLTYRSQPHATSAAAMRTGSGITWQPSTPSSSRRSTTMTTMTTTTTTTTTHQLQRASGDGSAQLAPWPTDRTSLLLLLPPPSLQADRRSAAGSHSSPEESSLADVLGLAEHKQQSDPGSVAGWLNAQVRGAGEPSKTSKTTTLQGGQAASSSSGEEGESLPALWTRFNEASTLQSKQPAANANSPFALLLASLSDPARLVVPASAPSVASEAAEDAHAHPAHESFLPSLATPSRHVKKTPVAKNNKIDLAVSQQDDDKAIAEQLMKKRQSPSRSAIGTNATTVSETDIPSGIDYDAALKLTQELKTNITQYQAKMEADFKALQLMQTLTKAAPPPVSQPTTMSTLLDNLDSERTRLQEQLNQLDASFSESREKKAVKKPTERNDGLSSPLESKLDKMSAQQKETQHQLHKMADSTVNKVRAASARAAGRPGWPAWAILGFVVLLLAVLLQMLLLADTSGSSATNSRPLLDWTGLLRWLGAGELAGARPV